MKVVIQRVLDAKCTVGNEPIAFIDKGMLLLVSFTHTDTIEIIKKMSLKISKLRIFSDNQDKMNLDINAVNGQILSISQFTLYADLSGTNRPSFTKSMEAKKASEYYDIFNNELSKILPNKVKMGIFGFHMNLQFINDGPVTIILDSQELF